MWKDCVSKCGGVLIDHLEFDSVGCVLGNNTCRINVVLIAAAAAADDDDDNLVVLQLAIIGSCMMLNLINHNLMRIEGVCMY